MTTLMSLPSKCGGPDYQTDTTAPPVDKADTVVFWIGEINDGNVQMSLRKSEEPVWQFLKSRKKKCIFQTVLNHWTLKYL